MKKTLLLALLLITLIACEKNNIGFVNVDVLIEKYEGAILVNRDIQSNITSYSKERDSIYNIIKKDVIDFQSKAKKMTKNQSEKAYSKLSDRSQSVEKYLKTKEKALIKINDIKKDSMGNIIKGFVKDYGKKHRFTYILGLNQSGNVLYGDSSKDLTYDILKELNKEFE